MIIQSTMLGIVTRRCLLHQSTKSSVAVPIPTFGSQNSRYFSEYPAVHCGNLISHLFQRYGFTPCEIPDFLKKNEFLLIPTPAEIDKSLKILSSLNHSPDFLASTVSGCPRLLQLDFLEKWRSGISLMGISNITPAAIRNVLEIAQKYRLCPDNVVRQIKHLKSLGISEATIIRILETVPAAIMSREEKIQEKVEFLKGIGVQKRQMDRIVGLLPEILLFGVKNRLKPLIYEFEDLGFSLSQIKREVMRNPKVLGLENGELSQCLEMLRNLKCRHAIKENIFREGELWAVYEVKLRIDCLRNHGLTYRDAFTVLWKEPRVILYEIEDVEKKIDFLVRKMKFNMQCLVEVPGYLGVNFDKQIVPRFRVIEYLRSQNGLGDEVGLRNLVKLSRLRFYNMYVKPYPECEKIYGRLSRDVVRSRHPVGMWKLFMPRKYPESGQVRSIINVPIGCAGVEIFCQARGNLTSSSNHSTP